jgi:RHS repeat-associated protein
MLLVGRTFDVNYRYGFNGKEHDTDPYGQGNVYDYGFRIYNPRLGKFLSVDPLSKSFPWYTPYQFSGNKPIWCIDLDGLEERKNTKHGPVAIFHETLVYDSPGHLSYEQAVYNPKSRFHRYTTGVETIQEGKRVEAGMIVYTTVVFTYQWYVSPHISKTTRRFVPYELPIAITPIKPETEPFVEPIDLIPVADVKIIPEEPVIRRGIIPSFAGSTPTPPPITTTTSQFANVGVHFKLKKDDVVSASEEQRIREYARDLKMQLSASNVIYYKITLYGNLNGTPGTPIGEPCQSCDGGGTIRGLMIVRAKYVRRIFYEEGIDYNRMEVKPGTIYDGTVGQSVGVDVQITNVTE